MLKSRVLTATILVLVVLVAVFLLPFTWFVALMSCFVAVAAWEWTSMMGVVCLRGRLIYVASILLLLATTDLLMGSYLLPVFAITTVWWIVAALLVILYPRYTKIWGNVYIKSVVGALLLVPTWFAVVQVREMTLGSWWLFYLFLLVWGADSGAYFVGKQFGRRKLIPHVSPSKSWAGVIGAIVVVMTISYFFQSYIAPPKGDTMAIYGLALAVVFACVVGDLLESMFKRHCGIKDSGTILPGHGGLMDRIDSLTAAAPVFAFSLLILGS